MAKASNHVQPSPVLPIHFFKIILKTSLERLRIPKSFTEMYEGDLSNPVFLKVPDSTKWEIHWTKQNGEVWFEKGWKQFAQNYSLDHGYMVVFKYEGTSHFDVLILDQSALEIHYPSCDKNLDQGNNESVQFLGETTAHQNAIPEPAMFSSRSYKRMRNDTPVNVDRNSNMRKLQAEAGDESGQGTKFNKTIKHKLEGVRTTLSTLSLNWPKTSRAQEIALNFVTSNPYFTVLIVPSHLAENAVKQVPKFMDYANRKENVILQLEERRWPVKFVCFPNTPYHRLTCGWSLFIRESKLQVGDICVFEVIDREVPKLKVHVTKVN